MKHHVVIVAGGSGSRMQAALPKQFLLLGGKPLLLRTLERFAEAMPDACFILVLPKEHQVLWKELVLKYGCQIPHKIVAGGSTRFESVQNAIEHATEGVIAIHDGVRPFPSSELIKRCFQEAEQFGSAIPVIPVTDTIRMLDASGSKVIDRSLLRSSQTPQCFHTEVIKQAYANAQGTTFTDCASVLESSGIQVHLMEGEPGNIKITVLADMNYASWLYTQQEHRNHEDK